ncbi:hypothetical protein ABK040_016214 [Willaertia magna]
MMERKAFVTLLNPKTKQEDTKLCVIELNQRIDYIKNYLLTNYFTNAQFNNTNTFQLGCYLSNEFFPFTNENELLDEELLESICKRRIILKEINEPLFRFNKYSTETILNALKKSNLNEFSNEEQLIRTELAACYRLFDLFGWTDTIYGHLTAKVNSSSSSALVDDEKDEGKKVDNNETPAFLINPFGLHYSEITASSLVKLDLKGEVLHKGSVGDIYGINKAGYVIHSAIHEGRPDIQCVMHIHFAPCAGLSCISKGLIEKLSQTCQILGDISYHKSEGIAVGCDERTRLQNDLGPKNKILILENHGVVTCGESIGEAFLLMYILVEACKIQGEALKNKVVLNEKEKKELKEEFGEIISVSDKVANKSYQVARSLTITGGDGFGRKELCTYMRYLDNLYERNKSLVPSYRV